jgi:cytochrome b involved in lipid metabolism
MGLCESSPLDDDEVFAAPTGQSSPAARKQVVPEGLPQQSLHAAATTAPLSSSTVAPLGSPCASPHARDSVTASELRQHATGAAAWLAVRGRVYDVTGFLSYHPGGRSVLLSNLGRDATAAFVDAHPSVNIGREPEIKVRAVWARKGAFTCNLRSSLRARRPSTRERATCE